ncbi:hypothetical protein [Phenylobacterium deserti]|uniref:Uncharacterized protein n=1 Tax=Phenylobacterium deserti TaxID=1914756 RepID=A0A328ABD0_9CAUL|nr:hypothetical protein [Phenylobacterium deserti]RAK52103.1 hypothetical protein DJ018_13185 [Phenylobacterium deserti]
MAAITKQTAMDIALAYREVETAEGLLKELREAKDRREAPDVRDAFGRRQAGLQLGVPSGHNSQRLFDVPWSLAIPIIEAHVAQQRAQIAVLTERARLEMAEVGQQAEGE